MIAFGARIVGSELAKDIVKSFLEAEFEGGGRHQIRIDMISAIENKNQFCYNFLACLNAKIIGSKKTVPDIYIRGGILVNERTGRKS